MVPVTSYQGIGWSSRSCVQRLASWVHPMWMHYKVPRAESCRVVPANPPKIFHEANSGKLLFYHVPQKIGGHYKIPKRILVVLEIFQSRDVMSEARMWACPISCWTARPFRMCSGSTGKRVRQDIPQWYPSVFNELLIWMHLQVCQYRLSLRDLACAQWCLHVDSMYFWDETNEYKWWMLFSRPFLDFDATLIVHMCVCPWRLTETSG